ncbi:hypothetical protein QJS04_geneDACA020474 [Acorus gramineus]|uniref:Pectinesterase inhibitor domain-containing protein n=1 Tax=Acorus gramineus TaxID=55184 RepID=A0AAV9ABL4_ACOGR|nr:hypothetical protein QJS04_geneDACA020474 [Acorus gramineus]
MAYKLESPTLLPTHTQSTPIFITSHKDCNMARRNITSHLLLASLAFIIIISTTTKAEQPGATQFIRTSCTTTRYPQLCITSLSAYASTIKTSPLQLAHAALSVSLNGARSTSTMVSKLSARGHMRPREAVAMRDCVESVADSVDELRRALGEMGHLRGHDIGLKINDIQTWVSAALTDEDTCVQGFTGKGTNGKVKENVRGQIVKVAQLTCNALALINGLASLQSSSP